jgi:hypothetical protein
MVSGDEVEKINDKEPRFKLKKKIEQHRLKVNAMVKDLIGNGIIV